MSVSQKNRSGEVKTKNYVPLSSLIPRICWGKYTREDLNYFFDLVVKMSGSYIKYQEVMGKKVRWERKFGNQEVDDMAIDCVAELFRRPAQGFERLQKYFGPFFPPIREAPSDTELLVLLRRLVIKKTKQELSRIFKERDPEGAKVIRNIRVAIKNSDDLSTIRELGREFVFFIPPSNGRLVVDDGGIGDGEFDVEELTAYERAHLLEYLRKDKNLIPDEVLKAAYLDEYGPKDHVSTIIRKMLNVVADDTRWMNCIAIDAVTRIIRFTKSEVIRQKLLQMVNVPSPFDMLQVSEINKAKERTLDRIRNKIHEKYVSPAPGETEGKISKEKGDIYQKTLEDVIEDIVHSVKVESYFKHIKKYMPELTQRQYRKRERTVFEYLGKLLKKWFREELNAVLDLDPERECNVDFFSDTTRPPKISTGPLILSPAERRRREAYYIRKKGYVRCIKCGEFGHPNKYKGEPKDDIERRLRKVGSLCYFCRRELEDDFRGRL